jgi:NAD(P)-dependent dehydrogenase (short-subunit alcohol dehydrogenase family)
MFQTDLLAGKRILVTGGGTGLGAAMARRFAELGAGLVLTSRRPDVLEKTANEIREATGASVQVLRCDVRDPAAVEDMVEQAWAQGPLDILVNKASTLHGTLYCTLECGKRWIANGRRGMALGILSTSTITGRAFTVPSAMAKSAHLAMIRSLAVEWGPKGIRMVGIAPGPFPTPGAWGQLRPAGRDKDNLRNPMGRVGEHIELTNLASYLVSDHASYINGEMITIDGGAVLRSSGAEDLIDWTEEQWAALRQQRGGKA